MTQHQSRHNCPERDPDAHEPGDDDAPQNPSVNDLRTGDGDE